MLPNPSKQHMGHNSRKQAQRKLGSVVLLLCCDNTKCCVVLIGKEYYNTLDLL